MLIQRRFERTDPDAFWIWELTSMHRKQAKIFSMGQGVNSHFFSFSICKILGKYEKFTSEIHFALKDNTV